MNYPASPDARPADAASTPARTTVLIADDHPIFRRGLYDVIASDPRLELAGEVDNGEAAWQIIHARRPAVAVLDIHMPRRSGLQVARELWAERWPVALIILTMDKEAGLLQAALDLGVRGYLLKEDAATELLSAIHLVAAGQRYVCPALADLPRQRRAGEEELRTQVPGLVRLTPSERRILKLIAADHTSKEIAAALGCSQRTVETHRQNICYKLELTGTHSLLRFAFDHKAEL